MARVIWSKYMDVLNRKPLRTQMVQSTIMLGLCDVIAQRLVEKNKQHDVVRTVRFMGIGCFFVAPIVRGWYVTMERIVGPAVPPFKAAVTKVAMDQLAFAPVCNALFISIVGGLQGLNLVQVREKLNREYVDVMLKNWQLWPGVQIVNFFFVPFLVRPLVVGVVSLFWNSYLSWKTNHR